MNTQDLLNIINSESMSKREAIEYLRSKVKSIIPVEYDFHVKEDGCYKGYYDKFRGDYFEKLSSDETMSYYSANYLIDDFNSGEIVYSSGWSYKFKTT